MASATNEHDSSMQFSSGSVVFSVQNVLFRIPKALLQQHSEAFSSMLDMGSSNEETIVLQDSLEAFRDFRAALFTPLESCLNPSHPTASDLGRLLELLLLCHKYLATKLEEHIVSRVVFLTGPDQLASSLTKDITIMRVMEVATIVNQPYLAARARSHILSDLWSITSTPSSSTSLNSASRSPYETLLFAQKMVDKELLGAAYYQTLLYRWPAWSLDRRLSDTHRRHLKRGITQCSEEWQRIFDAWGFAALGTTPSGEPLTADKQIHRHHPGCPIPLQGAWLQGIWIEIARSKLQSFDIVGKLCAAIQYAAQYDCLEGGRKIMEAELERVKSGLYAFFVSEEAIALKVAELRIASPGLNGSGSGPQPRWSLSRAASISSTRSSARSFTG